ncbi:hypothetical protein [Streptomyces prunicolor]|uniref:hypothetical protein n=1 Tax=Streptomyces prunicolor TaxID=67348 RepID=UPI001319D895|nr:hypothetical protein [Streptomyces prunicolor]
MADFVRVLETHKKLPWRVDDGPSRGIYLLAAILRLSLGVGVAMALGTSGQVSGGFGAVIAGIAAMKIIERLQSEAFTHGQPLGGQPLMGPRHQLDVASSNPTEEVSRDGS